MRIYKSKLPEAKVPLRALGRWGAKGGLSSIGLPLAFFGFLRKGLPEKRKRGPKGCKREPTGAKREPQGAKRQPKGIQKVATFKPDVQPFKWTG